MSSLAGRVRAPLLPEGRVRIGGFGGAGGLRSWLAENGIDAVVDLTHPFAATISRNAAVATTDLGLPLARVLRPGWTEVEGDHWIRVPDLAAAAAALPALGTRVFLTIGRQGVSAFADLDEHWFLVRAIDPPDPPLPRRHEILLARGPFTVEHERDLLREHRVEVLVTKDSGCAQTEAKQQNSSCRSTQSINDSRPSMH